MENFGHLFCAGLVLAAGVAATGCSAPAAEDENVAVDEGEEKADNSTQIGPCPADSSEGCVAHGYNPSLNSEFDIYLHGNASGNPERFEAEGHAEVIFSNPGLVASKMEIRLRLSKSCDGGGSWEYLDAKTSSASNSAVADVSLHSGDRSNANCPTYSVPVLGGWEKRRNLATLKLELTGRIFRRQRVSSWGPFHKDAYILVGSGTRTLEFSGS